MATHPIGLLMVTFLFITQLHPGVLSKHFVFNPVVLCNGSVINPRDPIIPSISQLQNQLSQQTGPENSPNQQPLWLTPSVTIYGEASCYVSNDVSQDCLTILPRLWSAIDDVCRVFTVPQVQVQVQAGGQAEQAGWGKVRYELYGFF
ncbi:hypothetical protein O6H91_01G080300 [Diphasiastrum complanatum]|uniref:Uncharacterized protein n=1 Tax=Diphasiastrum complanatum TaxID=34168 RepID=A0ACC2ESK7_DIPCM|nr:hypothetical protein O6H91_01G080300 [Diphasiastrum complanatum]